MKKISLMVIIIILIFGISFVSANENIDTNSTLNSDAPDEIGVSQIDDNDIIESTNPDILSDSDYEIIVNDWDELQYYCSLDDKDYTLKLKENTNYYPNDPNDPNYQIKIKNNVKIIGSKGSWIGDSSSDSRIMHLIAFMVEDNAKVGFTFENITFKWIHCIYPPKQMDGIFIQMAGHKKYTNVFKNCQFSDINVESGHSTIVYLKKGNAIMDNCSFINCNSYYGAVSVYDPSSVKSTSMIVRNCYFENNYANPEPGCINNCGKLTVYNSTFYKNRAFWWAGAIHTHNGGNTTIYDSNFTDNVAGWNGGALYTYGYLQIYNTVFSGNNCTTNNGGGAIGACMYQSSPHIYIEKCLFENNANNCWGLDHLSTTGTGRGGAISIMDAGSIEVRDTTFIANAASIGTAICAWAMDGYGSPRIIIVNNSFINHTRDGDTLNVRFEGTPAIVENNYFYGNSIVFSNLTLEKLSEGKEQATFKITNSLANPSYYDEDILDRTFYDVYINDRYVKTVKETTFTIDFGDLDICNVHVVPTISNRKSNVVTAVSTREYVFVSKQSGDDSNSGVSRDSPVNSIKKALQLAQNCQNIILMDGEFSENLDVTYDVTIKGEGAVLTNTSSFNVKADKFTLKNLKIVNLTVEDFILQENGNLFVDNCVFENNSASYIFSTANSEITKSIFINNKATLIQNTNKAVVHDSVLLNNDAIISSSTNADLDYNWWGSTCENPEKPNDLVNTWLILNLTSDSNALEINHFTNVHITFNLNNDSSKYSGLVDFMLNVSSVNGTVSDDIVSPNSRILYTLTELGDGVVTVSYNNVKTQKVFEFLKSNPEISVDYDDIMVGEDLKIEISSPDDATGNITVKVGNLTKTSEIISSKTIITFTNLKADAYTVTVSYSGDRKYQNQVKNMEVNVNKFKSTTELQIGSVEVDNDLTITVIAPSDATGNVTLTVNNNKELLILTGSKAEYVIPSIPRGDYVITAVYNGDDKYLQSKDSVKIEVDNLVSELSVSADNITYGECVVVDITLNDDATGNVSASIGKITNTSQVINGHAQVCLWGVDAGFKNITVFYTGDDTYFNRTVESNVSIAQADLTFSISSSNIKIGQDEIITIIVPPKTSGTFTIDGVVLNIPLSGFVEYVLSDLEIGEHTITAIYNGNNYKTVENYTTFEVSEYVPAQWPDTISTGDCQYESDANGEIIYSIQINGEIISLTIDNEGNLYVTTSEGIYSYDKNVLRWNFTSNDVEGGFSGNVISREVIVLPKSGDTVYFINQSSGERYGSSNIYQASSLFAPVVDSDSNLYVVSEYQRESNSYKLVKVQYRLWYNGGDPILVDLGNSKPICSPVVNDDLIVVLLDGRLRVIDSASLQSKYSKSGKFTNVTPVIGDNNVVYVVLSDSIIAYSISGSQVWKTKVTGGVGDKLYLNSDGVYMVNSAGNLYKYDLSTGQESLVSKLQITSGILFDSADNIYFGSDNMFFKVDGKGNILWKSDLKSEITGNPVMDKNGVIYVSTADNIVYALSLGDLKGLSINAEIKNNQLLITLDKQATGNVSITINGVTYTEVNSDGKVVKNIPNLNAGDYPIDIVYSGDLRFNKSMKTIIHSVRQDLKANIPTSSGSSFSISLPGDATGTLSVKINGKTYTANVVNGKASVTLPYGSYDAVIVYSGDSKYAGFSKTAKITVKKASKITVKKASKITAKKKTFKKSLKIKKYTVTLKSGKSVIKKVWVTIKIGKKTFKAKTNAKGKATFKIKKLTKKGKYTATVKFAGNKYYNAATKKVKIVLK